MPKAKATPARDKKDFRETIMLVPPVTLSGTVFCGAEHVFPAKLLLQITGDVTRVCNYPAGSTGRWSRPSGLGGDGTFETSRAVEPGHLIKPFLGAARGHHRIAQGRVGP